MKNTVKIHPSDNVAVAIDDLSAGDVCREVGILETVPRGHKFALERIGAGDPVIKYGHPVGRASAEILPGAWVHTHNMETALGGSLEYTYEPQIHEPEPVPPAVFQGYRRADGRVGIRNELWILPLVGCVNDVCKEIETKASALPEAYGLDGVHHFPHPYGCSQLGGDLENTQRILADLVRHPNAGGVLCVALGCENNTLDSFMEYVGPGYEDKVRCLVCQSVEDEIAEGLKLCKELAGSAGKAERSLCDASDLVIGLKCGGSDGLSGITANPAVGVFSDTLSAMGGTAVLTEVPEMFGAETILLNRAKNREVFSQAVEMINGFKEYFIRNGQPTGENPSPGNKAGGITTLEDKSSGCIQKGGSAPVAAVLPYGGTVSVKGLNLLCAPGNDLVSSTALAAAGAQLILFTTGRGTPFSAPVPTVKISTNTALARKKANWIDVDAGSAAEGGTIEEAAHRIFDYVIRVSDGERTRSELLHQHGLAIWKDGVTL